MNRTTKPSAPRRGHREAPIVARRQFLRAGGLSVALPFLPSLFPRRASGQTPVPEEVLRYVALSPFWSGVRPDNFFPTDASASNATPLLPGMTIHDGPLVYRPDGNNVSLSPVLTASQTQLSRALLSKLTIMNGIDIPFYCGYHASGWLGNYRSAATQSQTPDNPTIDQIMAWSPAIYPSAQGIRKRSLNFVDGASISYGYRDAPLHTGPVGPVPVMHPELASTRKLYISLIGYDANMPLHDPGYDRRLVLDRIVGRYRSLRQSNRRMSASDRTKLDDHLTRLAELERRLMPVPSECSSLKEPAEDSLAFFGGSPSAVIKRFQLVNDVIAAAFVCGTSRIATVTISRALIDFAGNFHQDVEHMNQTADGQTRVVENQRIFFSQIFLDLLNKLEMPTGNGSTILDDSIVQWGLTHGYYLHNTNSLPVVIAGSAGRQLKTGRYLDFRNRQRELRGDTQGFGNPGLHINRWFRTVFDAMGISPKEYSDVPYDYVDLPWHEPYRTAYVAGQHESRTLALPLISS
jgi:Protein of unknown function (DUF1552)